MTFVDEVGTPERLSGGPFAEPLTFQWSILYLWQKQSTFNLEPEEPRKSYEKIGRVTAIILI